MRRWRGCCARATGPSSARAQIEVLDQALEQLPHDVVCDLDREIVMRIDSAGAASELCQAAQDAKIAFLVGFDVFAAVARRSCRCPRAPGVRRCARTASSARARRSRRSRELIDLKPWPKNSRVIIRRERAHPGAQLAFTDLDGHRFQATLTDLAGDIVEIERLHRGRANAEDRVRAAKQTGLENLPFREFDLNAVWLEVSLIAQDLIAWTQRSSSTASLRSANPKRCATGCCTPPGGSRSTPAARSCASRPTGHGPTSSPLPSRASGRYPHPPAERRPNTTPATPALPTAHRGEAPYRENPPATRPTARS